MKNIPLKLGIIITPLILLLVLTAQAKAEPYGWSPNVDNSWQGPPTCTDAKPDKAPILLQPNHPVLPKKPKKGEVVLYWHKIPGATGYNIYYGLTPRNYIFSAPNLGDTSNFSVGFLPNKIFYFAVQAKKGCAASTLSNEWSARPAGGGYSARTTVLGTTANIIPVKKSSFDDSYQQPNTGGTTNQPQYTQPQTPPPAVTQPTQPPKQKGFFESIFSTLFGK